MVLRCNKLIKYDRKSYKTFRCYLSTKFSPRNVSELSTGYKPHLVEKDKVEKWEHQTQYASTSSKKFTMLLPPPNVTGNLHLGHALTCTVQDVLCRWKRKTGYDVTWIPGTDHAGIATQVVVEKLLKKEKNLTRHCLGRENFVKEVLKWKNQNSETIIKDLKKMGTTLAWEREYFTMDEIQSEEVTNVFIELFNKQLIYRGESLVNWSCALESAISDIEVDSVEIKGPTSIVVPGYNKNILFGQIYDIAYKFYRDGEITNDELVVSTTRPETLIGDVAVAINPNDPRYSHLQNNPKNELWHPFRKEKIPVVFDDSVDIDFGTGAVKITPAHDKNDYELAMRHSLPLITVINTKGLISDNFEQFKDMPRFLARSKMLNYLGEMELLKGTRAHTMNLPVCSRSYDIIEFLIRPQWFLKCKDMANDAIRAVENGEIKIVPKSFQSEWFRWLQNNRDWCISRQLWWGHQIPAYKCTFGDESSTIWFAAKSTEEALQKAMIHFATKDEKNLTIERDEDVLDTWFSSALLPFSAARRQNESYYPLSLMETGHDILFFWVARMVMLGKKITGQYPFHEILLHSLICDANGRKMSKSLGNVISPDQIIGGITLDDLHKQSNQSHAKGILSNEELLRSKDGQSKMFPKGIPECGTDALRFTLCSYNIKNHFINFDVNECYTNKLFFNKIWQATRFTRLSMEKVNLNHTDVTVNLTTCTPMDKWILSRLANTVKTVESAMNNYNFHLATAALKKFFYYNLCDVYVETTKNNINRELRLKEARQNCSVLITCLSNGLDYMEPFTPFLVDELKSFIPHVPSLDLNECINPELEAVIETCLLICSTIRQLKNQHNISKVHEPEVVLKIGDELNYGVFSEHLEDIGVLSGCMSVRMISSMDDFNVHNFAAKATVDHNFSFGILTNDKYQKTDEQKEDVNEKKLSKLELDLDKLLAVVSNEGYQKSANEKVKGKHLERIAELRREIETIKKIRISSRN